MVFFEELDDDPQPTAPAEARASASTAPAVAPSTAPAASPDAVPAASLETVTVPASGSASTPAAASKEPAKLKPGFLQEAKAPLYGPEGSPEGHVAPETHKAHLEHKMNEDLNAGMQRGAKENNGIDRPPWYTKEWPKDCQYNAPGCRLEELESSKHATDFHKQMVRDGVRWQEALAPGAACMRLSFSSLCDEDLEELIPRLKGNRDVTELDLSHNSIQDRGVQALVAALAGGAAPNLQELRIYSNPFGALGRTMLTQGLPVLRKKLQVRWEEPSWAKLAPRPPAAPDAAATAA